MVAYRAAHPVFRRRRWFQGRRIRGVEDMVWFRHDGAEMSDDDWENGFARSVGVFMAGDSVQAATDLYGERMTDDTFFVIFNASELDLSWTLPAKAWGRKWTIDLDSSDPRAGTAERAGRTRTAGSSIDVPSRTLVVLRRSA